MTKIYVDRIKNDNWTNKQAKGRIIQNQIKLLQISSELRHETLSTRFIQKVPGLLPLLKCLVSDLNRNYMWSKMDTRPVI